MDIKRIKLLAGMETLNESDPSWLKDTTVSREFSGIKMADEVKFKQLAKSHNGKASIKDIKGTTVGTVTFREQSSAASNEKLAAFAIAWKEYKNPSVAESAVEVVLEKERKTEDEFNIEGCYDGKWEVVSPESSMKEARVNLKAYREHEKGITFRIKHKRVKKQVNETVSHAFDVFLNDKLIDTVFDQGTDPQEVKRSLINHDGYDSGILVKLAKKKKEKKVQETYVLYVGPKGSGTLHQQFSDDTSAACKQEFLDSWNEEYDKDNKKVKYSYKIKKQVDGEDLPKTLTEEIEIISEGRIFGECMECNTPASIRNMEEADNFVCKECGEVASFNPEHPDDADDRDGVWESAKPLAGHDYHSKNDDELKYIIKDASDAAKAMKDHDTKAEAKYLDQVNDATTILAHRKSKNKTDVKEGFDSLKSIAIEYKALKNQGKTKEASDTLAELIKLAGSKEKAMDIVNGKKEVVTETGNNVFFQQIQDPKNELNNRMGIDKERENKITVPSDVRTAVSARIAELKKSIAEYDDKGYNDISQKEKAIECLEKIMEHLALGNNEGLKQAQIFFGTLMSPITDFFPAKLITFLGNADARKAGWLDRFKVTEGVGYTERRGMIQNRIGREDMENELNAFGSEDDEHIDSNFQVSDSDNDGDFENDEYKYSLSCPKCGKENSITPAHMEHAPNPACVDCMGPQAELHSEI